MKPIQIVYKIAASPEKVWKALTDVKEIKKWSMAPAEMNLKKGGKWSLWGGDIIGKNTEIVKGEKLVQDWKEKAWEEFSKVTFILEKIPLGTKLSLVHEEVPAKSVKSIKEGWCIYYLDPLKDLVEGK